MSRVRIQSVLLVAFGCILGLLIAQSLNTAGLDAKAAGANTQPKTGNAMPSKPSSRASMIDPSGTVSNRYAYFPGTEQLGPAEVRIVACGTGMPAARRGQAAACFLFELGNGDKFLFDIGTGSMANIMSLNIPADFLRKIFVSHLHTDHFGDLDNIWAGGWTGGRTGPLEVWGPSGAREDMGTAYAIDGFM